MSTTTAAAENDDEDKRCVRSSSSCGYDDDEGDSAMVPTKTSGADSAAAASARSTNNARPLPRFALNSVEMDDDEEGEGEPGRSGGGGGGRSGGPRTVGFRISPFTLTAPSCVQDFTKDWVLYVMQQYYAEQHPDREKLRDIGEFAAEKTGDGLGQDNNAGARILGGSRRRQRENNKGSSGAEDEEEEEESTPQSHHILSQAYKVMVDVPDPPPPTPGGEGGGGDETTKKNKSETEEEDSTVVAVAEENGNNKPVAASEVPAASEGSPGKSSTRGSKIHHLFVKVPPKRTAKFERMVRRNRTLEHEVKVYSELLRDLQTFVKNRVGDAIQLKIPKLYHGGKGEDCDGNHVLVIEDLAKKGYVTRDWFKHKLTHDEVTVAVKELAKFHACGLAYRMSLKEEIDEKYPYLEDDLYTSNMAKELLAKYLDSFLHFLSLLPGIQEHVLKLRKISNEVFQLLVKLRRPSDPLGTRFNTVCHGDMWMGNLMFKGNAEDCIIIDFHSAQFLSPATDLAHLMLTSTSRSYRQEHWDEVVQTYYDTFNRTLAEFGLILRHLGTTYTDFLYEVKRALRGQFLCVAFIIPIGE